jgi:hypothetical protein
VTEDRWKPCKPGFLRCLVCAGKMGEIPVGFTWKAAQVREDDWNTPIPAGTQLRVKCHRCKAVMDVKVEETLRGAA